MTGLYLLKLIVDKISISIASQNQSDSFNHIALLISIAGSVVLLGHLCRSLVGYIQKAQVQLVSDSVYDLLHTKALELDLEYFENPKYFDILHLARREGTFRPARIAQGVIQVGQNAAIFLAMIALLFAYHWSIPFILGIVAVPGSLIRLRYAKKIHEWQQQRAVEERRATYFHTLQLDYYFAKEVKLFNIGSLFKNRFGKIRKILRQERLILSGYQMGGEIVGQIITTSVLFALFTVIVYQTLQGKLTIGDLIMYFQAFQRGFEALRGVLKGVENLYEDSLFLSSLYEFLSLKKNVIEPIHPIPVPCPIQSGVVFENVSFQYPGTDRKILKNISLTMRPGDVIGLVGENGSGKTTLVKLLCRFYDLNQGTISIDGINLKQFSTISLRREISVVFQDFRRFFTTVRENIWYGNTDLEPDGDMFEKVIKQTGIDVIVKKYEHGYDTFLGRWLEKGEEPSIGQQQKIALARALFRDAQIMILDEPTSAMDANSEYNLFQEFEKLTKDRITILISHRISTLRMADKIFVMNEGMIVEDGTHEELVCCGGKYAELYNNQAGAYQR